jgi:NADPH:quinone reductase-like Zn-dependent oxidoreductase
MSAHTTESISPPETMTAARVHQFGGPAAIALEQVPVPAPGKGEVLVKVNAAGVGPWDAWIRAGKSVAPQPLPLTLGSDLSGVVAGVGPGVTAFALGEPVFGVTNPRFTGAYAEYAATAEGMIAPKPSSLTDAQAASVPVIAVTAWQALFDEARLSYGARVLIHGAAGNVGAYAVQFARAAGVHTTATVRARDVDYVRSLGAEVVIDVQSERFEEHAKDIDAVIDLVGADVQERSYGVMKPGAILVSAVAAPDQAVAARHGVKAGFFLVKVTTDHLRRIAALIESGELRTRVGLVLPLGAVQEAHEMLDGLRPHPGGKIVLQIS